jgi:cysteine desulfurase
MNKEIIYLDNASTTFPCLECLAPFYNQEYYYNASNLYNAAMDIKFNIDKSRENILKLMGIKQGTLIFTSGGCESNNMVIKSLILSHRKQFKPHIITSKIEHHSIIGPLKQFEELGLCEVTYLKPNNIGEIKSNDVQNAIKDNTILISIMHVNNEIGTINNIQAIGKVAQKNNIYFHTDATQSVGKIKFTEKTMELIDFMTFSAHKFHGPKGIGGLYIKNINSISSLITGGNQEFNLRAGKYNYPAIRGMEIALEKINYSVWSPACAIKEHLINELKFVFKDNVRINGDDTDNNVYIVNFSLKNCDGEAISMQLADEGIYTSNGSACNTGSLEPSYVLKAIDCPDEFIYGAIRVSWNNQTTITEIDKFVEKLKIIYKEYMR